MAEMRRKFDADFKEGAVRLVRETGKPIARWPGSWGSSRARWRTGWRRTGGSARAAMAAERGRAGRAGPAA